MKTPNCIQSWASSIHLTPSQPNSLRSKLSNSSNWSFSRQFFFINSFFPHLTPCSASDFSILRVYLHVMFETVYLLFPLQFKYFSWCFISYRLYFMYETMFCTHTNLQEYSRLYLYQIIALFNIYTIIAATCFGCWC